MKKVLVTGTTGFLGSRIQAILQSKYQIYTATRSQVNFSNLEDVMHYVEHIRPDVVIHCAAISDIGYAEANKEEHDEMNIEGTRNLALACKETKAKMIFMSSDQVYHKNFIKQANFDLDRDGNREGRDEHAESVYAKGKLEGEKIVTSLLKSAVCLRLTWMYDMPSKSLKNSGNLMMILLQAKEEGSVLHFASDDYRGVTYVREVIDHLPKVFDLEGGVYNYGSSGSYSMYDIALHAGKRIGLSENQIQETRYDSEEGMHNLTMNLHKLERAGISLLDSIAGVDRCMNEKDVNEEK